MSTVDVIPRIRRTRACAAYVGHFGRESLCDSCKCRKWMHKRFQSVTCSQCGGEFGPANEGYSMCSQHGGRR